MVKKKQATREEWVATLALLAAEDREAYRNVRKQAWQNIRTERCSDKMN